MTEKNKYTFPPSKSISPPIITIIVATLNSSPTLQRCIESIISQTYPHKELIIIDGGSTDGSLPIIEKYSDCITYWESKPDRGIYHAWNKALGHAHGDWICFLGADDYFHDQDVLTMIVPYLEKATETEIRIVYGKIIKVNKDGHIIRVEGKPWSKVGWLMRHGMSIPHPGMMHHCRLFEIHGRFDETFRISGDYDLLLRELKDHPALFVKEIKTVVCQIGGMADLSGVLSHQEVARSRRKCGLNSFSWVWTLVYLRAIWRSLFRKLMIG